MSLLDHCRLSGWRPRHIGVPGSHYGLLEVLEEVIACRDAGANQLSKELIDLTEAQGWHNPWLEDNRAWLLVAEMKHAEARQIWERLVESQDPALRPHARRSLELLDDIPELNRRVDEMSRLRSREQINVWAHLCWQCLKADVDPWDGPLSHELREAALSRSSEGDAPWDQQLLIHDLLVDVFDQALSRWESG